MKRIFSNYFFDKENKKLVSETGETKVSGQIARFIEATITRLHPYMQEQQEQEQRLQDLLLQTMQGQYQRWYTMQELRNIYLKHIHSFTIFNRVIKKIIKQKNIECKKIAGRKMFLFPEIEI